MNDIVEKTWKLFAFKTMTLSGKLATKKWRTNIGIFFVIQHAVFLLNVFFATFSQIDVENREILCIFMHRENAEFWFTKFQKARIHSLKRSTFKSQSAFLVSEKCVLRIWLWKNAGRGVYATSKFWHKIQDSKKTVDYLLNRSRVVLGKSFLQLSGVLTVVYTTYPCSQFRLNAGGKLKYNISWIESMYLNPHGHILMLWIAISDINTFFL